MVDIHAAVEMILAGRQRTPTHESMLVAVSGIDGSGKGYVTERLAACLQQRAVNAVAVNADGWLNLVPWQWRRSSDHRAGRSALDKAIRTDPYCAADNVTRDVMASSTTGSMPAVGEDCATPSGTEAA